MANAKEKLAQSRAGGIGWASEGVSSTTLFTFYTHTLSDTCDGLVTAPVLG